jgi:fructose-bisphosphate aldolase, class I
MTLPDRSLTVFLDHGAFGEPGFLSSIEDMNPVLERYLRARPDAIGLPPGSARRLAALRSNSTPAVVLRADTTNAYLRTRPATLWFELLDTTVRDAVETDAAAVIVALMDFDDHPEVHRDCVRNIHRLRDRMAGTGIPLIVEILVLRDAPGNQHGWTMDLGTQRMAPLVRQAFELGADVIKVEPSDPIDDFPILVTAANGLPVIAGAGGKTDDEQTIRRSARLLELGASGLGYGRSINWAENPVAMTRALMGLVHDGTDVERALSALVRDHADGATSRQQ